MLPKIKKLNEEEALNGTDIIRKSFHLIAKDFNLTEDEHPHFAALEKKDDSVYYIKMLSVLPEYRHNGYGRMLLDYLLKTVKKYGGSKILIFLIFENKILLNWYEQYGFAQTGLRKLDDLPFTNCDMEFVL